MKILCALRSAAYAGLLAASLLLAGCSPTRLVEPQPTFYRPPAPAARNSPTAPAPTSQLPGQPQEQQTPSATVENTQPADCKDNLLFIKDVTVPDGTVVAPNSTIDKRWEVENNGNCSWTDGYRVKLIAGPELNAQRELALYPARSGTRAVIRIQFKAPAEPGTYRSAWQAYNPQGAAFGDPFFMEIKVE